MSFVRPELAERLRRFAEPLIWAAVLAAGVVLTWRGAAADAPGPFVLGLLMAVTGMTLLRAAIRRLGLTGHAPGPGVVVIDEGRIAYLGPRGGGFVDLAALVRVELTPEVWVLVTSDTSLTIPRGAAGAEHLPDALTALPGFDLGATTEESPVWRSAADPVPRLK